MISRSVLLLWAMLFIPLADAANADAPDPAAAPVQTLTAALLKSMQAGRTLSMNDRYRALAPAVEQVFALPLMARLAVGPVWASFSSAQQAGLVAAFSRFTIANYAHNFDDFSGQRFEIDAAVASRGEDKIVRSRLIPAHDTPVELLYRMRDVDGAWKVIDVDANGVSELALRRTDFAAAIAAGGAPVLIAHLNKVSDDLLK